MCVLCRNLNSLSKDTCALLFKVERFGRIITSLKPNFRSVSILISQIFQYNQMYHFSAFANWKKSFLRAKIYQQLFVSHCDLI
jgi:hypothetical protein